MVELEECPEDDPNQAFTARFMPDKNVPPNLRREHCVVSLGLINKLGKKKGEQVRIETDTPNGRELALYTIVDTHSRESDIVFVGYNNLDDLEKRLKLSNNSCFTGRVKTKVVDEGLTDEQAEKCSEFIERLCDNGINQRLVVIAPHGGKIEEFTDIQAEYIRGQFLAAHVSEWICKGFKEGEGEVALDRWHITATDISENSFPKLKTIMGRQFEYSIAFHGRHGDSICIGGSMQEHLKQEIRSRIEHEISDPTIVVAVAEEGRPNEACPEAFNGNNMDNIVNRLCKPKEEGGQSLQIEQSKRARRHYHDVIAKVVADVLRPLIEV